MSALYQEPTSPRFASSSRTCWRRRRRASRGRDCARADDLNAVGVQPAAQAVRVRLCPHVLAQLKPFVSDRLKRVAGGDALAALLQLAFVAGILAFPQETLGLLARRAGVDERHEGVGPQSEQFLLALKPIGEPPQHRSGGGHEDMEPLRIADLVGLRCGLERSKLGVRERHRNGISSRDVGIVVWMYHRFRRMRANPPASVGVQISNSRTFSMENWTSTNAREHALVGPAGLEPATRPL